MCDAELTWNAAAGSDAAASGPPRVVSLCQMASGAILAQGVPSPVVEALQSGAGEATLVQISGLEGCWQRNARKLLLIPVQGG